MKVLMHPHLKEIRAEESGIRRVVEAYFKHLPDYGIELVPPKSTSFDLKAVHAGTARYADVVHSHGIYWTADYNPNIWEWGINFRLIRACRQARAITCPSEWVAESFKRDMRLSPDVVGHGLDLERWGEPTFGAKGYVLWNKNRVGDVCDPTPVRMLANAFPDVPFVSTIAPRESPSNVHQIFNDKLTPIPHEEMKGYVKDCSVYLATTKETFGIGILEAMASSVPVLGFDHGGIRDIVQHGVNGYLAEVGNYEDLIAGLHYCFDNAGILSKNGLEMVKKYRWEDACEKIAKVYERAMEEEAPTVSIIIPCFNYAGRVGKAIESALGQSYRDIEAVVVVDDGSDDSERLQAVVEQFRRNDDRLRLVRQENAGVAIARNRGISEVSSKYICCLDADDAIAPEFIEVCVRELEQDRGLGIAYTGLWYIKPDASEGKSSWPGEWNYDKQLNRQNQIPTCCVFRRKMWERLGGYRQRYAPEGAGSEDAEFWTRAGAYGFAAKRVTAEPLFIYSWQSGRVSGNPDYREVDWLSWHPWVKDQQHPFASYASVKRYWSHPVRQYDEPVVSVIIPVGPGHEEYLIDALDSLESQTYRKWEAIVVFDQLFHKVENGNLIKDKEALEKFRNTREYFLKAYPYVRMRETDGRYSPFGAGYVRNAGAKLARAPFLVFLDADDWLYPDCLMLMLEAWKEEEAIIYTDYVGKAVIDDPSKLAKNLQERIYHRNKRTNETIIGYRAADYDVERAQKQPFFDKASPIPYYIWCNVTSLIPKKWHDEIGGFDESMESWEDVDYHWRMAKAGKCYNRIVEELMVYRFHTGTRRQGGLRSHKEIVQYLTEKYKEIKIVACGCGSGRSNVRKLRKGSARRRIVQKIDQDVKAYDDRVLMIHYNHPNKGNHMVIGVATKTNYGYRGGGSKFLVHKEDIEAQPNLFVVIEGDVGIPKSDKPMIEPPQPIGA